MDWHNSIQGLEEDNFLHFNLKYQSNAYERIEHYLRNALRILSKPKVGLQNCANCLKQTLEVLPKYLNDKVNSFFDKVRPCEDPINPVTGKSLELDF